MPKFDIQTLSVLALSAAIVNVTNAEEISKSFALEEVIVTAQRRDQSLQDVPLSVNPVSGAELDMRNVNDITQLTAAAPSLQVGLDNTLSVRGIGTQIFSQTVDSSVAIALDDVNLGRLLLAGQPFNDVAAVEVLNGPQGLLFGKNASAGLVNIKTKRPEMGSFLGVIDSEYSDRDTPASSSAQEIKGILNVPLTDNSALRLNLIYSDQDPVATDVTNSAGRQDLNLKRSGIKAKYLLENDSWELYAIADYNEENGVAGLFERTYRSVGEGSSDIPDILAANDIVASDENLFHNSEGEFFRDLETGGAQATLTFGTGDAEFVNIAAWRYFDRDQQLDADFHAGEGTDINRSTTAYDQFSYELRYILPENSKLTGQGGLYFFDSSLDYDADLWINANIPSFVRGGFPFCVDAEVEAGPPPACPVSNRSFLGRDTNYTLDTQSLAAFGQLDYEVSDTFIAFAGARITRDKLDLELTSSQEDYFIPLATRGTTSDSISNTNFSFKLGGQYHISDDIMLFGSYGEGYKAPGFNDAILTNIPLRVGEETSATFELGLRSQFIDGRLTLNATLFHTDFEDYQAQAFSAIEQTFLIQNAGSVESQGAEIDISFKPISGLTVNWTASLLDSNFGDFDNVECYPGQTGCDENFSFNARGLATPVSAEVTSTLQGVFDFSLSNTVDAFIEANWYYRSELNSSQNNAPQTELDAVNIIGASAGLYIADAWRISLFCRNCTNEITPRALAFEPGDASDGIPTTMQSWGFNSVRSIGATVSYSF